MRYERVLEVCWLAYLWLKNHPKDGKNSSGCVGKLKQSIYDFFYPDKMQGVTQICSILMEINCANGIIRTWSYCHQTGFCS